MDEPLSALDKQLREHMQIELRRLHDKLGMTTVYVTHDQREALTMSDRVAVMKRGRIMQLDAPQRLYERPANRFVAEFIGESTLPAGRGGGRRFDLCRAAAEAAGGARRRRAMPADAAAGAALRIVGTATAVARLQPASGAVANSSIQGESFLLSGPTRGGDEVAVRGISHAAANGALAELGDTWSLGLAPQDTILLPEESNLPLIAACRPPSDRNGAGPPAGRAARAARPARLCSPALILVVRPMIVPDRLAVLALPLRR